MKDATTDLNQIDRWWTENPRYNIGCAPDASGYFVLDADPPHGTATLNSMADAEKVPVPRTFTVTTPRGGLHLWFLGRGPSTVQKLGPKLDTRGVGGYVLVPPSQVGDNYYVTKDDADISPLPDFLTRRLEDTREHHAAASADLDLPANIDRARRLLRSYVASGDVAIEGQGGDDRTYRLCAELANLGLSADAIYAALEDTGWNAACIPPWSEDELRTKAHNATTYAQNDSGAWAVAPAQETFGGFAAQVVAEPQRIEKSKFYPYLEDEQDQEPEPEWLIPNVLPTESIVLLYGESRSYKSFLSLDIALSIAAGVPTFGATPIAGDTVYVAAEGPRSISRRRRPAWRLANQITGPIPFAMVKVAPSVSEPGQVIELIEQIKARGLKPKLIVFDTLTRMLAGLDENNTKDAGTLVEALELVKREFGCTVIAVHHAGKDGTRGARGSSRFFNDFDTVLEVKAHRASKAVEVWVRKQKDAEESETPWTFEGKLVGPSLVFFPTDAATHRTLTEGQDAASPKAVAKALAGMKAHGEERAVSTGVLAYELCKGTDMKPDTLEKQLRRAARPGRPLEAYHANDKWFLPAQ